VKSLTSVPASPASDAITRRAMRAAIELELVAPSHVVNTGVRCRDLSQSNGVAIIESGKDRWVVKDASKPATPEGSWRREVAVYSGVAKCGHVANLAPALIAHDEGRQVFVIEALVDQWLRFDRCDLRTTWSNDIARNLGRALARWHTQTRDVAGIEPICPWLITARSGDRLEVFDHNEALAGVLDRILDNADLSGALKRIEDAWRSSCLMHGDIRFANVFFHVDGRIRLIDWETAGWGDPRWDVAGALQELISNELMQRLDTATHQAAVVEGYGSNGDEESIEGLPDFVAARLAMRAIQLAGWAEATDEHVDAHMSAAQDWAQINRTTQLELVAT